MWKPGLSGYMRTAGFERAGKAYLQIETDAEKVMKLIDSFDGVLPFTDKASPEVIRRELAMSKNEFKRAVGNLLKNGRIEITEKAIRRI